ncbi:hypothetical protein [Waddlia chondrophila]|uniref:Uncharacterized protein n=1 Tax=Waddlia chondrophila (strain ATCC VR-1470 / WSU 86-1044) TaxID=716544 RepID=D6YWD5_WADCW|nr:hypothetical protein [Waddlia chondrophila]ADI38446.1 hypothetical protein wcw_1089 [Waddlia chondrophila WSU 86-1044]
MIKISNADKQARYRKKEHLKRLANNFFRDWQLKPWEGNSSSPKDVQRLLDKAIELPSGWTDKDYEKSVQALEALKAELWCASNKLKNDVDAGWSSLDFMNSSDPRKFIRDNKEAIERARNLASHLISALELSNCNNTDQAAALMEVVRYVGRSLASSNDVRRSQATAICLVSIGSQYKRPDWFAEELANIIKCHVDSDVAHQVGILLITSQA